MPLHVRTRIIGTAVIDHIDLIAFRTDALDDAGNVLDDPIAGDDHCNYGYMGGG